MFNRVILVGRCGRDPETHYLPDGKAVTTMSLATDRAKLKDGIRPEPDWHYLVFFGRTAEVARDYLRKGSPILVEGRIRYEKWKDEETGADKYMTKILVQNLKLLGSPPVAAHGDAPAEDTAAAAPPADDGQPDEDHPF